MKTYILFVCLGNICRSPAAEGVFRNLIKKRNCQDLFHIDSAGTGGWHVGNKADRRIRAAAQKRGIPIESIARQITLEDFSTFDLILTMDNDNLNAVNQLSKQLDKEPLALIKPLLNYSQNSELLEVPDPYYGGEQGFEKVLDLLEDACNGLFEEINS